LAKHCGIKKKKFENALKLRGNFKARFSGCSKGAIFFIIIFKTKTAALANERRLKTVFSDTWTKTTNLRKILQVH